MKKIILILSALIGFVNAQYFEVELRNCMVEFADTSDNEISYSFNATYLSYREYSKRNVEVRDATISNGFDMNYITNFATRTEFVDSLNIWAMACVDSTGGGLIDSFYLDNTDLYIVQGLNTKIADLSDLTPESAVIDSGVVIGNFMYIFQPSDTTIIDVSSLSGGEDSLWSTSNGYYQNVEDKPFIQSFQGYSIENDSLDIGAANLPYIGLKVPKLGDYYGLSGMADVNSLGRSETFIYGYMDFLGNKNNNINIADTSEINIAANEKINITANGDVLISAEENTSIIANEDVLISADENISITGDEGVLISAKENSSFNIDKYIGIPADSFKASIGLAPYDIDPNIVMSLDKNQSYSLGFAAIANDTNKIFSNIYYGTLDATNTITDIARVETTPDHSEMMYLDLNKVTVDRFGVIITDSANIGTTGQILTNVDGYAKWRDANESGWAQYNDGVYTSLVPFAVTAGDTTLIPNAATTSITSFLNGLGLYNPLSSIITPPTIGDAYVFRVNMTIKPSNANAGIFIYLDIGGSEGIILNDSRRCLRGTSASKYSFTMSGYALSQFVSNGGQFKIEGTHDMDIYDISYLITKVN